MSTSLEVKVSQGAAGELGPAPAWGACGVFTSDNKVVATYSGGVRLTCGSEKFGYRHIKRDHRSQFETLAAPTALNWRDLAHWAIESNMKDPDRRVQQNANTACRVRVLYLKKNGGASVGYNFTLIFNSDTKDVITVFPGSNC